MTEKRSQPEFDDVGDPLVSRSYRDIASEKVPAELDQAILQQARRNVGNRTSKSVIWLRPMAWAATIGLSLAIVIELSSVPMSSSDMMYAPAEVPASVAVEEAEILEEIRLNADPKAEPARKESMQMEQRARKSIDSEGRISLDDVSQFSKAKAPANMPSLSLPAESTAQELLPASSFEVGEAKDGPVAAEKDRADADVAYENGAFENVAREAAAAAIEEIVVVNEAPPLAHSQETGSTESGTTASVAARSDALAAAIPEPCDTQIQETPETWLECIEDLEEAGHVELADQQREQLREDFPDFELP
jgi:hypothetical protein